MIKLISYPKLGWPEWQAEYREDIRVHIDWDRLQRPNPKVVRSWWTWPDWDLTIWYPWTTRGRWRDGKRLKHNLHTKRTDTILWVPALWLPQRLLSEPYEVLLLDGCHRLRDLRPRVVVVDGLEVRDHQYRCFTDLFGPEWREKLGDRL